MKFAQSHGYIVTADDDSPRVVAVMDGDDALRAELIRRANAFEGLRDALALLAADVAGYQAWERPCHALDAARAALALAAGHAEGGVKP